MVPALIESRSSAKNEEQQKNENPKQHDGTS